MINEEKAISAVVCAARVPITIEADVLTMFQVIAALQLAARHPEAGQMDVMENATRFARRVQHELSKVTDGQLIYDLIEQGWSQ